MKLLVIEDDLRAYPAPEVAGVEEFKELVKRDRGSPGDSQGRKKQRAARELAYIYHMVSPDSPYRVYDADLREELICRDLFHDYPEWRLDDVVTAAMEKYKELKQTELSLLLVGATAAVNKLRSYFETVNFTDIDENGRPVYSAKDVVSNLSNLGKVVEGLQNLKEQVEKEELGNSANRKGVTTNKYSE
jgi:hypothetical protein